MNRSGGAFLVVMLALALLLGPASAAAIPPGSVTPLARYVPQTGDHFAFAEIIAVGSGVGNYTGYNDATYVNGTVSVTATPPNQTESVAYNYPAHWKDNYGGSVYWNSSGTFTFSASTFHYVSGTDNQTGYVNPYVWFYVDNTLGVGATLYLLNTQFTVRSLDASYPVPLTTTGYALAIYAQGTGSYQRNDVYGIFTADYTWKAYFDPGTGYIVGYVYTEVDRDTSGNGFSVTDTLTVSSTSFTLTAAAPPPRNTSYTLTVPAAAIAAIIVVLVIVAFVVAVVLRARRRRLPQHAGPIAPAPPTGWTPPPLGLGGSAPPQVVLRETVKVPCAFCGTLIDSTATVCPQCGAPRT